MPQTNKLFTQQINST